MSILKSPIALAAAAALCGAAVAAGQSRSTQDLGVGKLLVSSRGLGDPNFAESVVLLIQYDQHGTVGLMINRRTQAPISRVLKDVDAAKRGSEPVYIGGPVELDAVLALLRSQKKPEDATSVLGQVYVVSTKPALEKALAASSDSGDLRVYLGYCGWDAGQLENELRLGGWWIFEGEAGLVFDPRPESVWSRLISRTEQQIARSMPREPIRFLCGVSWEGQQFPRLRDPLCGVGNTMSRN
jgi:putative transcriptional regulator